MCGELGYRKVTCFLNCAELVEVEMGGRDVGQY